jgi:endonuclease/exonuclease/phosphatase family metal-dependent hydrolase
MTIASYNLMAEPSAPSFSSRLPLVIEAISSAITRSQTSLQVLCLQEVNEEMLPLLLADPFIQKTYPFSSHSPSSLLPSYRNVVSLSSAPFRSLIIAFKERHKSMLAISFTDVEVINVHLSSALSDQSVKAKMQQMKTITDFAQNNKAINRRHFIVAGDFNLTTSSYTVKTALSRAIITPSTAQLVTRVIDRNFWEDAFEVCNLKRSENVHDDDSGSWESATFDRSSNPLAALSEPPIDKSPQRYDRILYQKGGSMKAEHFERFGLPNEYGKCASDHYGVLATLRIAQTKGEVLPTDSQSRLVDNSKLQIIDDLQDLPTLISAHLPSQEDRNQREQALQLLHQTLSKDKALNDLIVAPLGSYLMDTYFADSDIDVLVIASISPQAFFHSASTQLHSLAAAETGNTEFKGVHFVNSLVSIIELIVMGIKFDVQYCQARELIERYVESNHKNF